MYPNSSLKYIPAVAWYVPQQEVEIYPSSSLRCIPAVGLSISRQQPGMCLCRRIKHITSAACDLRPRWLSWIRCPTGRGWSGGAKVLCILHHWGVQLILAYSWARPAILVVGKGRGGMFLFLLFLHFHSCSSFSPVPLFHLLYSLFYLFSPFLWETTQNDPQGLTCR